MNSSGMRSGHSLVPLIWRCKMQLLLQPSPFSLSLIEFKTGFKCCLGVQVQRTAARTTRCLVTDQSNPPPPLFTPACPPGVGETMEEERWGCFKREVIQGPVGAQLAGSGKDPAAIAARRAGNFSLVALQSGDLRPEEEYANARARASTGQAARRGRDGMEWTRRDSRGRGLRHRGGWKKAGEHGELKQTLLLVVPRARHHPRFA